jgi:hypothetical protein
VFVCVEFVCVEFVCVELLSSGSLRRRSSKSLILSQ